MAGALDAAVLDEINFARTHPAAYARALRDSARTGDRSDPQYAAVAPDEMDEAIDFLERQRPLPPLKPLRALDASATALADAQGERGQVGHVSPDGERLGERLHRQGVWAGESGEDISYGYQSPRGVVRQLIIDSGVASRGHRQNIFDPTFQVAGVGCAAHRVYQYMCVIDFAGALVAR